MVHPRSCEQVVVMPTGSSNFAFVSFEPALPPARNLGFNSVAAGNDSDETDFYCQFNLIHLLMIKVFACALEISRRFAALICKVLSK